MAVAAFKPPLIDASDDPTQNLQTFGLLDLVRFTRERTFSNNASKDFHLFFVGRDDVHDILKYVISRARVSIYLNMFGYDDDELNKIVMKKVLDPTVTVVITLDKSQAGGKHEKALLDLDRQHALAAFNSHFTLGQSLTHQISHTKGFVVDGKVGAEGSTNWSDSGEGTDKGTFFVTGQLGGVRFKAQNNTQTIFTDLDSIARFQAELIAEHLAARDQGSAVALANRQQRPTSSFARWIEGADHAAMLGRDIRLLAGLENRRKPYDFAPSAKVRLAIDEDHSTQPAGWSSVNSPKNGSFGKRFWLLRYRPTRHMPPAGSHHLSFFARIER